jgi:hypothetical protein
VTITGPSLEFTSSTTLAVLPSTLNGNLLGFIANQTVSFRLDDAQTGLLLSGTTSPNPISAAGSAVISVTIPSGTSGGTHSVYAVGSAGDVASASISVSIATARVLTTAPYSVTDLSSGSASDASNALAFDEGVKVSFLPWPAVFSATRYVDVSFSSPLPTALTTSGMAFNLTFASTSTNTSCFYFQVLRRSTNEVLGTYGSAANPLTCSASGAVARTSTSLAGITTTAMTNDLKIRLFGNNVGGGTTAFDLTTISGSSDAGFTLYPTTTSDINGASSSIAPWSLEGDDGALLTSGAGWDVAFSATKYLRLGFPSYVPPGASAISATFSHSYKSATAAGTTCTYLEIYSGATLLTSRGSASTPLSCNATASFQTDTVSLPEIDTVAEANGVVIRVYTRSTGGTRKSLHDAARITINYSI